jgi:3-isopropylmalate dehydrogenase
VALHFLALLDDAIRNDLRDGLRNGLRAGLRNGLRAGAPPYSLPARFTACQPEHTMSANNAFHIAVLPGDGIGPEVMAPALDILRRVEELTPGLNFRFSEAPAGATEYRETGKSMSEKTIKLCEEADAILLGACGLPSVRYPDNTEIMPQVELRFIFDLYAGVRPARLVRGAPSPIVGAQERGIDFVLIRESTEGLFASMGKGVTTHDEARETLVVTRDKTERLFDFSLRLAQRRKARGKPGRLTLVDKANVFKAFNWQRAIFAERKPKFPDVATDMLYVDACAAMLVKKPWDFDVMVMENMFGDILSDLAAGLIGGLGIAPSADIGDKHAVFQPCHGTAPDIMGQSKANPTAMILSTAMMLDYLADRHDMPGAAQAAQRIETAVDKAYETIKPMEFGGTDGTASISKAVMAALG